MAARGAFALAWATVGAVFLLMTLGNVVSATGSGLACPDWPLCHGRLIPPLRADILIEYGHRVVALVASIMIVATIVVAIRRAGRPGVRRVGIALVVLLAIQILLGGITVLLELPDLISTAHLLNSLLIFGGLLVLAATPPAPGLRHPPGGREARVAPAPGAPTAPRVRRLVGAGLAVLLVQMALGGYVRHSGAGLACPDFPLCTGSLFPEHALGILHWVHRWLGVALLGLFVHLAMAARQTRLASAARTTAVLAAIQVTLGILTVLLQLDPAVRAAHAAVGYALWGMLVWLGVGAGIWQRLVDGRPGGAVALGTVARAS